MFRSSTIGFITTEMTQHRMTTILLFVCLSLCLEVLQSQLLKCGDPCIYSDDCESRCCFRDSPKGSGKCVLNSIPYVKCYGPNESNRCFYSHQCHSGCCFPIGTAKESTCVHKNPESRKCLGPNNNDLCFASENCYSGCCYNINSPWIFAICGPKVKTQKCFGSDDGDSCAVSEYCKSGCCQLLIGGICRPKAKENEACDPESHNGLYDNCPCESGLICEKDTPERKPFLCGEYFLIVNYSNLSRRICKKPDTANKCN
ncbi:keratin-associated protein 4-6-like isoform X6 [Eleutherodactylus coqui]|uniref:keratin-associated protein 4-6-like isoform X6 n=1 Tax=Eleutherodactylus coqui TaxID=57060 RepID=UPI0034634723